MSWNWNNEGLPFLPGYTFRDITKSAFHRPQTLTYRNGYVLAHRPTVGIGQDHLLSKQLIEQELSDLWCDTPDITYDSCDQSTVQEFIPAYVALDKKVLTFHAYFQTVQFSPEEKSPVRPVIIYYFLEDDSMSIFEPRVQNSGMPQGKRIKRHRLPKNEHGEYYQWKDLNIGMDLEVYRVKYHITHCDPFTKEFMESEGIVLNNPEPVPEEDTSSKQCKNPQPSNTTAPRFDHKYKFLTMDGKVLCFFALWDDTDSSETRRVILHYYLGDDTLDIKEIYRPNSGRVPFILRRQKLPKKMKPESVTFPSSVLEVSAAEVDEYYSPKDFQVGQTVTLQGRCYLLYDCDDFTREYYQKNHPDMDMTPSEVPKAPDVLQEEKTTRVSLNPKPPKENLLKMLENQNKVLRYTARLDTQIPEYEGRRFVLSYFLSNDMISIFESPSSGFICGKFLEKTRVPKPGSSVDDPDFYSPADFAIGATVEVFSHRFVLTDADHYVLAYLEANASQIPLQTLESLRQKLGVSTANNQPGDQNGDVAETS